MLKALLGVALAIVLAQVPIEPPCRYVLICDQQGSCQWIMVCDNG